MNEQGVQIKICGITNPHEAYLLNKYEADYAGFVLFYENSKRHNSVQNAWQVMRYLEREVKTVAVTVSPTLEQAEMIERMEFKYIQVHGKLDDAVAERIRIPIIRAYNIGQGLVPAEERYEDKIAGYVLDGKDPGSGKVFDWEQMKGFDRKGKLLFLAGGLQAENVRAGIEILKPDIVDVSSGVEDEDGKSEEKIKEFVRKVREHE